ncbi:MAG: hypothetical protein LBG87_09670, partial [Spirochaetaceae bacterium]|nr:hypothetical protein [Spirochaetaceae bacterium]
DFSMGFSMTSMLAFIMLPVTVAMMLKYGFAVNLLLQGGIVIAAAVVLFGAARISKANAAPAE